MKKARIIEVLILFILLIAGGLGAYGIYYHTVIKPNLYTIVFQDIDSIIKGSPVRFMGIIVGHVRNLDKTDGHILCQIVITKPHTTIPDGSVAKVEYNGLGGSKSIEIMPPKTEDPDIKGIVATDALRISDFADAFKGLREVALCIKQFVDGITPQSTLSAAKAVAEAPDFTVEADKALNEALKQQQERQKKLIEFRRFQTEIEKIIDKIKLW